LSLLGRVVSIGVRRFPWPCPPLEVAYPALSICSRNDSIVAQDTDQVNVFVKIQDAPSKQA
jgi:hypothetical protein